MARHTNRQQQRDELAFPVRVKIAVPGMGLGSDLNAALDWLRSEIPAGNYACHSAPGMGCDTLAVYFREPDAARRFTIAHPHLRLADGTQSAVYRSAQRTV